MQCCGSAEKVRDFRFRKFLWKGGPPPHRDIFLSPLNYQVDPALNMKFENRKGRFGLWCNVAIIPPPLSSRHCFGDR